MSDLTKKQLEEKVHFLEEEVESLRKIANGKVLTKIYYILLNYIKIQLIENKEGVGATLIVSSFLIALLLNAIFPFLACLIFILTFLTGLYLLVSKRKIII